MNTKFITVGVAEFIAIGSFIILKETAISPKNLARDNYMIQCLESGIRWDECQSLYLLKKKNGQVP